METEPEQQRWLDDREQEIWRGYLTMSNRLMSRINGNLVSRSSMSDGDYGVLVGLSEAPNGRLRAFELARVLEWEKSRLSHQLSRMTKRGLVRREECPSDARGAFIAITAQGRTLIEAAAPHHVADVRAYFVDVLTPAQLDALGGIVTAVLGGLGDGSTPATRMGDNDSACDSTS